jgi:hypothetical protein
MHMTRVRHSVPLLGLLLALGAGVLTGAPFESAAVFADESRRAESPPPAGQPSPADGRHAADWFGDITMALAEAYGPYVPSMCETAEMIGRLGAMAVQYLHLDLLGLTAPLSLGVDGAAATPNAVLVDGR